MPVIIGCALATAMVVPAWMSVVAYRRRRRLRQEESRLPRPESVADEVEAWLREQG
jgi:hypothetical protein